MGRKYSYEIEAKWPTVQAMLDGKKRGEDLRVAEIAALVKPLDEHRFRERCRRYLLRRGIHLTPLPGLGWRLATEDEQVKDRAEHYRHRAKRATARQLHAAISVDETKLSPQARQLRDLHIRHASAQLGASRAAETEQKTILGVPAARPRIEGK